MSSIDIRHCHGMASASARLIVEDIAIRLGQKFSTRHEWHDNCLNFTRPGVNGTIAVDDREVRVRARLGVLLKPMQANIEREIQRQLQTRFPS